MEISNNRDGDDVFLSSARVIRQPADNSCLYHSLSYCLAAEDLIENVYSHNDGFQLRTSVNTFIRDNGNVNINLAPEVRTSITEAVHMEGYSCQTYSQLMSNTNEWGGVIEIATVAEMFAVNICIYIPVHNSRLYKWLGTFRCSSCDADTTDIYILYKGQNHYDSLINVVSEEKQTSTVSKFTTAEKELLDDNFVDCATDEMPTTVESPAIKIQQYDKVLQERISNKLCAIIPIYYQLVEESIVGVSNSNYDIELQR